MSRPRFSILGLIAAVVACGVAFAGLRSGSDYWQSAFYTMTVVLLLAAVVLARYRRRISRAFWFGFAVFGWGSFLLTTDPWKPQESGMMGGYAVNINRNLFSTLLIQPAVVRIRMGTADTQGIDQVTANTVAIVVLLVVLGVATGGGFFAAAIEKRARRAVADPSRRSVVVPSLIILAGLGSAGLEPLGEAAPNYSLKFDPDRSGSPPRVESYSEELSAAGESSLRLLASQDRAATVYRLNANPSFDHPVIVRITRTTGGATLQVIVLDSRGGDDSGDIAIARTVELDQAQWDGLERHLAAIGFWEMPSKLVDDGGSDGTVYVVEGVKDGHYHFVNRWSPEDLSFLALCRYMLDLTGLKLRETW